MKIKVFFRSGNSRSGIWCAMPIYVQLYKFPNESDEAIVNVTFNH